MVDRHFSLPSMAELYDHFHFWGCSPDDDFYLEAVMEARSVLDVGCGTGLLLRKAREHGHTGRLVGLDPADAMLAVGRRDRDDVEWTLGDLVEGPYDGEAPPLEEGGFDLVVMTGHAFQVFLTDEETRENLSRVRRLLAPEGRLIFETRNPAARGWEAWNPERVRTVRGPEGRSATSVHRLERVERDLVTFTSTYTLKGRGEIGSSRSTLRFPDAGTVRSLLGEAGLRTAALYGYWDRSPLTDTSEEIIVFARPA
ncbi:class I SAM-dependent methyltransferase [Nocardiopsis alba]|uniref:class I SAM-dependent methyltransferase n=1 Tax=Nocardiopsis alba TaxID=53437 RepID=UPI003663DAA6